MQYYTIYLFLENDSTCFGCISTHIRNTHKCIYSIRYLSNRYCYLPLLWKSWNLFECDVGIVLICFGAFSDADDGWRHHPKHVEQFSRNK